MADLNALIARGYQSQPLPDPFVQYSKMQQLENSATQNRLAQQQMQENAQMAPFRLQEAQERAKMAPLLMQETQAKLGAAKLTFDEAKQAKDVVDGLMVKSAENGGPTDPVETIKFLISHPNKLVQQMGKTMADSYKLLQEFEQQQKFNQGETGFAAPAAAPTAAYMPPRILVGSQSVEPSALGSGTFDVNAPAAAPVAAPAAAATAAPTDKLGKIEARIAYLTKFPSVAQAKLEREELIKLRAELSKPHVVGNVMLNGVGDVIYKGPAKSSIQQRVNPDQTTSFVSVDDETNEATPILINGEPLISARKIDTKIMGNLLLDDTGKVIFEGPAGSTIQQVTNGDIISFVSVDNKTRVATPITQDGKPLTSVSVPAQDLAFRKQKDEFERNNPTLSIQQVNQSDGSAIVVAVNTRNATYQPVVSQGDTFVPTGPAMPISGGTPSAAAAPSAATTAPLAETSAASSAAVVPNALVGGAVNNALLNRPTSVGQPLISAPKKSPETKSDFEKMLESLGLSEDEKNKYRLAKLAKDTAPSGQGDDQFERMMEKSKLSEPDKIKLRKQWLAKQTKISPTGGDGGEKFPTGSVTVIDPTDPTGKKVIVVTAKRAITEGLTPFTSVAKEGGTTEGERKAATLLQRLQFSESQLLTALGEDPNAAKPGLLASAVAKFSDPAANLLTPAARQRVEAAQLDILDAALTLGTGAAYTNEQLKGYAKSYFPQIGDKPENIKEKQARLSNLIQAAKIAAGRAEKSVPPAPNAASQGTDGFKYLGKESKK